MSGIRRRQVLAQAGATIAAMALRPPAWARPVEVDLALVLAVDISRSITADEHRIQREGYADAFRSDDVIAALAGGIVAVTVLEWARTSVGVQAVDWTLIRDRDSAARLAATIAAIPYAPEKGTSIGGAIASATRLLATMPYRAARRVIDISGDGESVEPDLLVAARKDALAQGVTINGLPLCRDDNPGIVDYYAEHVVAGPGAFLVAARGFQDFPDAVRRKLVLEIAGALREQRSDAT